MGNERGFTLIELLVAIAISAVIALLAYQAIDSATRVVAAQEGQKQKFSQLQQAIWWLEQDALQMTPRPILDELGSPLPAMQLINNRLEWTRIALYPTPQASGGLVRVAYELEGDQLIRWSWPVIDRAPDTQPRKTLLLTKVVQFQVNLLDEQQQWQTFWPQQAEALTFLPRMIEVIIEREGQGQIRRLLPGVEGLDINENPAAN